MDTGYGTGPKLTVIWHLRQWELIPFIAKHPFINCTKVAWLFVSVSWGDYQNRKVNESFKISDFLPPELRNDNAE